jgi:hypothetical protein
VDSVTRQRSVVAVQLPGAPIHDVFALSPDGRTIYYGAVRAEADIWIAERRCRGRPSRAGPQGHSGWVSGPTPA